MPYYTTYRIDSDPYLRLDKKGDGKPCGKGFISARKKCSKDKVQQLASALRSGDVGARQRVERGRQLAQERSALKRAVEADRGKKARVLSPDEHLALIKKQAREKLQSLRAQGKVAESELLIKKTTERTRAIEAKKKAENTKNKINDFIDSDPTVAKLSPKSKEILRKMPEWMVSDPIVHQILQHQESGKPIDTGWYVGKSVVTKVNPPSQKYPHGSVSLKSIEDGEAKGSKTVADITWLRDDIKTGKSSFSKSEGDRTSTQAAQANWSDRLSQLEAINKPSDRLSSVQSDFVKRNKLTESEYRSMMDAPKRKFSIGIEDISQVKPGDVVSYQSHMSDPRLYYKVTSVANGTIRGKVVDENNRESGNTKAIPFRGKTGIGRPRVVVNP